MAVSLKNNPGMKYVFWDRRGSDILVVPETEFSTYQRQGAAANAIPTTILTVAPAEVTSEPTGTASQKPAQN